LKNHIFTVEKLNSSLICLAMQQQLIVKIFFRRIFVCGKMPNTKNENLHLLFDFDLKNS